MSPSGDGFKPHPPHHYVENCGFHPGEVDLIFPFSEDLVLVEVAYILKACVY